ncbi:MAG: Rrf2 family transcriptional regulator [Paludibacteraceae bacterium]|nr:Rrf2 family transcriptional regulator [Paludibacteraceae bacterium]MEE3482831.1 Rrf2 family transcriptional regulator [Bacteroidales bacterium]
MMISTRGRYALRVFIDLADQYLTFKNIRLKDISERQSISLKYLENIMSLLVKNKLVEGTHGKGGGYKLTRKPEEYTVGEILRLTEVSLAPVSCLDCEGEECPQKETCRTLPMWRNLEKIITDYLDGITIADLQNSEEGMWI